MGGPSKPGLGGRGGEKSPGPRGRDRYDEHRGAVRSATFKRGELLGEDGAQIDCIVRNVSESGCMIKIDDVDQIPDVLKIRIGLDQPPRRAEVVWRSATLAGLQFIDEPH